MARRRRSTTQKLVNIATTGMPSPVRTVAGSRIGSLLIVVGLPILIATGIVHISWNGALPSFSVDKERAEEVRERIRDRAEDLQEDWENRVGSDQERPAWNTQDRAAATPWRNFTNPTPDDYSAPDRPATRIREDLFPRR